MTGASIKIAELTDRLEDLKRRNATLQLRCDDRARTIALLKETVANLQSRLDQANGF